ncbi:succinate dehydrogenase cytochrome b subunit [Bradymonas sediminis]|uniref:Uncharacterized protein n=1 Tax=Bradymonas sediminis TaxID=1548548 RepID=A0A2Z4FNX9_9DELT|nr:succinate dehydrogenase cytochrome b subunit [Bradymonas sediminis]AWV90364.1 hypothetical protein DN745_13910 [Bradymonas sediminis]TDP72253.1 succinate dehydrogenase subunit C [Bradymonas sediminis]
MYSLKTLLTSGIGRKLINWATAVGLFGFVVMHLLGNLTLFANDDGTAFNAYAAALHSLGPAFYLIEIGLLLLFVFHIYSGITMWRQNRAARPQKYVAGQKSKNGPSHYNLSSTKMAISGIAIAAFVIIHVAQFRFQLFTSDVEQYALEGGGLDLYALVADVFSNPGWVAFYCGAILFLGWHLRHGVWSMVHSIGSMNRGGGKTSYAVAAVIGLLLALGFFVLPIYLYVGSL